jgi:hypothetical protein
LLASRVIFRASTMSGSSSTIKIFASSMVSLLGELLL